MNSYSDGLGFSVIKGHNPKDENEVAVSLNILKESGLSIGDYISKKRYTKLKYYFFNRFNYYFLEEKILILKSCFIKDNCSKLAQNYR
jgi:hypothetical protein